VVSRRWKGKGGREGGGCHRSGGREREEREGKGEDMVLGGVESEEEGGREGGLMTTITINEERGKVVGEEQGEGGREGGREEDFPPLKEELEGIEAAAVDLGIETEENEEAIGAGAHTVIEAVEGEASPPPLPPPLPPPPPLPGGGTRATLALPPLPMNTPSTGARMHTVLSPRTPPLLPLLPPCLPSRRLRRGGVRAKRPWAWQHTTRKRNFRRRRRGRRWNDDGSCYSSSNSSSLSRGSRRRRPRFSSSSSSSSGRSRSSRRRSNGDGGS